MCGKNVCVWSDEYMSSGIIYHRAGVNSVNWIMNESNMFRLHVECLEWVYVCFYIAYSAFRIRKCEFRMYEVFRLFEIVFRIRSISFELKFSVFRKILVCVEWVSVPNEWSVWEMSDLCVECVWTRSVCLEWVRNKCIVCRMSFVCVCVWNE